MPSQPLPVHLRVPNAMRHPAVRSVTPFLPLCLLLCAAPALAQKGGSPAAAAARAAALDLPDPAFDKACEAASPAWQAFVQQAGGRWISHWNRATGTPKAIYGSGLPLSDWRGDTQEEARRAALLLLEQQAGLLGLGASEFREAIAARIGQNWSFVFDQHFRGIAVLEGRADVRIHRLGKVSMFGSVAVPIPEGFTTPRLGELDTVWLAWQAAGVLPSSAPQPGAARQPRLVIWADVQSAKPAIPVLAWEVPISAVASDGSGPVGRWLIDAGTGRALRWCNDKHECAVPGCTGALHHGGGGGDGDAPAMPLPTISGTVMGYARIGTSATAPLVNVPMPGLEVNVQGHGIVVTDANGQFSAPVTATTAVTVTLDGAHCQLVAGPQAPSVFASVAPGAPASLQLLSAAATADQAAHTSTYYWTHQVNEFLRSILGDTPQLQQADNVLPTVNLASVCNAYYTANTINFYAAGGGCNNTGYSSVVAHEWGHGLDDRYGGVSQINGLSEGWSDICSMYLLDSPLIADGFFTNGQFLRTGANTRQYPGGAGVHDQGESWMGFAWKLRERLAVTLNSRSQAVALTNAIVLGTVPADAISQRDAVREVFLADDDDGDLTNGTPHGVDLAFACNQHSLPYPLQPSPANDECVGAIYVGPGTYGPFSTQNAWTSAPAWPCAAAGTDVWFGYVAGGSGQFTATTCSAAGFDTTLEILTGSCGALTSLACNDDSCATQSLVSAYVNQGQTYWLRVGGFEGAAGTFSVTITAPPGGAPASQESFGLGCYRESRSFYETFAPGAPVDVANTALTLFSAGSSYLGTQFGAYQPPSPQAQILAVGDDGVVQVPLSSPFLHPGGVATALEVGANGFVSVAAGNSPSGVPDVGAWLASPQPRWGCWHDFDPTAGGAVKFEDDGLVATVTWEAVRDKGGAGASTWQLQFDLLTGSVVYAWQSMSAGGNGWLIGYAAGGASLDVGPLDLSAALPTGFATGTADSLGLVEAADLPRLNSVMNVTGTGYPLGSLIGFVGIGVAAFSPGIDLAPFGAAGCRAYTSPDLSMRVVVQGGQSTLPLYVPQDPAFLGAALHSQTFALAPAANLLGITTSNAVRHVFGY